MIHRVGNLHYRRLGITLKLIMITIALLFRHYYLHTFESAKLIRPHRREIDLTIRRTQLYRNSFNEHGNGCV